MFKKLVSNLPFNPGLLDQTTFYLNRLKQETAIRRIGFLFISLAFMVEILAVVYPPQNSLAASPNDILSGITTKSSILTAWDNNAGNVRAIYSKFGITRENIADISGQQTNATVVSAASNNFWSIGRLPLSAFGISNQGQRTIDTGPVTIYQRPLHSWDSGNSSSYPAFHGKNKYGVDFWILKSCGNATFKGSYLPQPPKPKLIIHKSLYNSGNIVVPGAEVKFRLEYQNIVKDSLATNVRVTDTLDSDFQFVSLDDKHTLSGSKLTIPLQGETGYKDNPNVSILTVKVKKTAANHSVICNQASIDSDDTSPDYSERPCVTVKYPPTDTPNPTPPPISNPVPQPEPTPTPPPSIPTPSGYCVSTSSVVTESSISTQTAAYVQNATVAGYSYDVDADGTIDYVDPSAATAYQKTFNNLKPGFHSILVYVQIKGIDGQKIQTDACQTQSTISETPRVNLSKSVSNITQGVANASGTTVKSGDIVEFRLVTTNVTSSDYKNYHGADYFGDVLQYSEISDSNELYKQGLSLGADNYIRWNTASLKANTVETKIIRVKIKNIVPTTNTPSNVSPDYDCRISNNYGNEVLMNVECPLVKEVAKNATSLPNTGPGTTVVIGFIVTTVVGYFFARARIMSKEIEVIREGYRN